MRLKALLVFLEACQRRAGPLGESLYGISRLSVDVCGYLRGCILSRWVIGGRMVVVRERKVDV